MSEVVRADDRPTCVDNKPGIRSALAPPLLSAELETVAARVLARKLQMLPAEESPLPRKGRPSPAATRCSSERAAKEVSVGAADHPCCRIRTAVRQSHISTVALLGLVPSGGLVTRRRDCRLPRLSSRLAGNRAASAPFPQEREPGPTVLNSSGRAGAGRPRLRMPPARHSECSSRPTPTAASGRSNWRQENSGPPDAPWPR